MTLPPAGSHGGDAAMIAQALGVHLESLIDLSASLNPFAPDVSAIVRTRLDRDELMLRRYPDSHHAECAVADLVREDAALVVLTNGAAEAIALVAAEVHRGSVIDPEFSLYARHLPVVADGAPRWRSNPSNPMGTLASPEDAAGVWDESFFPLATGHWSRGDTASWRIGSLTKVWACPALRIGYVIAPDPDSAARIRSRQPRWSVNGVALAAIEPLIELTDIESWARQIRALNTEMASEVAGLGFQVTATRVNWILVHEPQLRERLAGHGVVVRDCTSFGLPETFRVALPRLCEFDTVIEAFEQCRR